MKVDVIMPQMGESIAEGTITKWMKKVGDSVKRDEPLFEISTDKVDAEIPSPGSGTLAEIVVQEGNTVAINTVVARIESEAGAEGQPAAPAAPGAAAPEPKAAVTEQQEAAPPETPHREPQQAPRREPEPARAAGAPQAPAPGTNDGESRRGASREEMARTRSSPLVRRIAAEHGVEIQEIEGTGIAGRVTKDDVLSYVESRGAAPAAPAPGRAPSAPSAPQAPAALRPAGARERVEPMSVMRKKIAEHMVASRRTSAHVHSVFEVEMTKVVGLRDKYKNLWLERHDTKLTFMPFIAKAAAEALKRFPVVNSSIDGENIVYHEEVNIGVAVALDWGLIVPVVRNVEEKSLLGIARAINDLAERARTKKLLPDEVHGGTFTITNPGHYGGQFGLPIINQPQVAILGVGAIEKRPVVRDDAIAIRPMMFVSLGYDHRLVDGAIADQFLAHVKQLLEEGGFDGLE